MAEASGAAPALAADLDAAGRGEKRTLEQAFQGSGEQAASQQARRPRG